MKAVVQRVSNASVVVGEDTCATVGRGFLVLLGVAQDDTEADADYLAEKIAGLRVFEDDQGRMNLSLADVGGSVLAVSNFTLLADCRKGRRPSFSEAAAPDEARSLYERFVQRLRDLGVPVQTGQFQGKMQVSLCNDGPVTLIIESQTQGS
jgi:D-tyrosyl-tRNA(Tyr) deacylase